MLTKNRFLGCLFGLACGDALGASIEGKPRGTFEPLSDIVSGGPHKLQRGQWTDDTSMALCLAESLVHCNGFDPKDQMDRYLRWHKHGYFSSTGRCFSIGSTTYSALYNYARDGNPYAGRPDPWRASNGSIMRLAPVPMFFMHDREEAIRLSGESSRTTHGLLLCIDSCRLLGAMIWDALNGRSKEDILTAHGISGFHSDDLNRIAAGDYLIKTVDEIMGADYVLDSLTAALWCFAHTESYQAAVLAAANLGDDADTTAAVCGQLAGAYYGLEGIPEEWIQCLSMWEEIQRLAIALMRP